MTRRFDPGVHTSEKLAAPPHLRRAANAAVKKLHSARSPAAANAALLDLLDLRKNGARFSPLMPFPNLVHSEGRLPDLDAMMAIKGFSEIRSKLQERHAGALTASDERSTFTRRAILAVYFSTSVKSLTSIRYDTWAGVLSCWKDASGHFIDTVYRTTFASSGLHRLARALADLNANEAFYTVVRQPRLPSNGSESRSVRHVLSTPTNANSKWIRYWTEWIDSQPLKSTVHHERAFLRLLDWLERYPPSVASVPEIFLTEERRRPSLLEHLRAGAEQLDVHAARAATYNHTFVEWLIDEKLTDSDDDGTTRLGYPLLTISDIRSIRGSTLSGVPRNEAVSRPLPTKWRIRLRHIIADDDYAWPRSLSHQYFSYFDPKTRRGSNEFVPTLSNLFLTMLELPLRRIQVLCLDSGEGDKERFDVSSGRWVANDSPFAGLWERSPAAKRKSRGVVTRISTTSGSEIVGFYINTNKTQDRNDDKHGDSAGYLIPWHNENVLKIFEHQLNWQKRYNPVRCATSYRDIPTATFGYSPSKRTLQETPDRFYLFRSPLSNRGTAPAAPPTWNQCQKFWMDLMAKLEVDLRASGEEATIITKWNQKTAQAEGCYFNIHGLRVATLTAFAEAGVPIEILSKLVAGHSTILMTIYYLKFNSAHISDLLTKAAADIEASAPEAFRHFIENQSWDKASRSVCFASDAGRNAVLDGSTSPAWSSQGIGICPYGGTRCFDGGPLIKKFASRATFASVPGGPGNCVRCRHFVSGAAFLIPMWLFANKLLARAQVVSSDFREAESELERLETERYLSSKEGHVPSAATKARIAQLEGALEHKAQLLNSILEDLHATWRYLELIKQGLEAESRAGKKASRSLVAPITPVEIGFTDGTRFELVARLVQGARIYPVLVDEALESERDRFVDEVLSRLKLTPLHMQSLDRETKRRAADAAAQYLIDKVGAQEVQSIHDGLQSPSRVLGKDMEAIISISLQSPISTQRIAFHDKSPR